MDSKVKDSLIIIALYRYTLLFVFLTAFVSPLFAQGNLLIYPKRVVFDGKNKIEKLVLSNTGEQTAIYNISFVEYEMNEAGEMKIIQEPKDGMHFASSNVRVFPRQVTLAPGEAQTVKVQLVNTHSLADGEYRSHLYFRHEEEKIPLGETSKKKDSTISVQLKAIFGISIPCIVRIGQNTTTVNLSDLQIISEEDNSKVLQFKLNRTGNMSLYGDFAINYTATDGNNYEVAKVKGVGVYTPNEFRIMKIKLPKLENINFNSGVFNVIYFQNESKKVLSEANLRL